jgi:hypothetical protein
VTVSNQTPVRFESDIKPYFDERDRDHMLNLVGMFDLHLASDVCANHASIRDAIASKRMPIPEPWPDERIATFLPLFDTWRDGGCQP